MTFELDITQFTANKQHNGTYTKIWYFLTYILSVLSTWFQLGNWSAPAWLGSAQNLHSSARLELGKSGSGLSLLFIDFFPLAIAKLVYNESPWLWLLHRKNAHTKVTTKKKGFFKNHTFFSEHTNKVYFPCIFLITSAFSHTHPPTLSSNIIVWPSHPSTSLMT